MVDTPKSSDKVTPQTDEPSTCGFVSEWLGLCKPQTRDTSNKPLFGADGKGIKAEAVMQGDDNTCFFMSPLASVAKYSPDTIKNSIKQNQDGSFTVTFAGAKDKPQIVPPLTVEEQKQFARVGENGTWPAVILKAFGQYLKNNPDERDKILGHSAGWFLNSPQEYADKGKASEVLRLLTGYMPGGIPLKGSHKPDSVRSMLGDNFRAEKPLPVVAGVAADNKFALSKGLHPEHDYSVLGYEGDLVIVRDPRGKTEANSDGKVMASQGGVFKMSTSDFAKAFDELLIARDKPLMSGGAVFIGPTKFRKP